MLKERLHISSSIMVGENKGDHPSMPQIRKGQSTPRRKQSPKKGFYEELYNADGRVPRKTWWKWWGSMYLFVGLPAFILEQNGISLEPSIDALPEWLKGIL